MRNETRLLPWIASAALVTTLLITVYLLRGSGQPLSPSSEPRVEARTLELPREEASTGQGRSANSEQGAQARTLAHVERQDESAAQIIDDAIQDLRTALDASVFGTMDAGAILDATEHLLGLDLDDRAIPEPDRQGNLRFPLIGTPEGVEAHLVVSYTGDSQFASVVAIQTKLEGPPDPYLLDNALRAESSVNVRSWTDDEGNPLHISIMTDVQPHYKRMEQQGMDIHEGTIVVGIRYHLDLSNPGGARMTAHGLQSGEPGSWEIPLVLEGAPLEHDRLKRISDDMLRKYGNLIEDRR